MILTDPISWIVASLTRSSAVRPRNTLLYQINELNCGESYRETSYQPNQMNCRKDEKSKDFHCPSGRQEVYATAKRVDDHNAL